MLGTYYSGLADVSGELALYYWDSNNYDNMGSITATISAAAVPGPVIGAGLAGLVMTIGGLIAWRRRRMAAAQVLMLKSDRRDRLRAVFLFVLLKQHLPRR